MLEKSKRKHSDETKRKISESRKGKCCGEDNINYGKERSEEVKKKISDTKTGTKLSEETKRKMSELRQGEKAPMFGKKHSDETKRKISEAKKGKYSGENNPNFGKKHSDETKRKISKIHKGKIISEETKKKIMHTKTGISSVISKLSAPYSTYAHQLEIYEEIRRTEEGYLEIRCTYCGKWFMPKIDSIRTRIKAINGTTQGESRLYCSQGCKKQCPIYNRTPEQLMKEDTIRAGRILPEELNREVQPDLRWLVLARDNYTCQICGSKHNLHCHHFEGTWMNQLQSADVDMCITLCKKCHLRVHSQPGCTYYDLRRKYC